MSCRAGKDDRGRRPVALRTRRAARTRLGRGEQQVQPAGSGSAARGAGWCAGAGRADPDMGPGRGGRASALSVRSRCPHRCAGFSRSWLRRWCGTARERCHGRMARRLWPTTRRSGSGPLRRGPGGVDERSEPGGAEEVHAGQNDDDGLPVGHGTRIPRQARPALPWPPAGQPTSTTAVPASRSIAPRGPRRRAHPASLRAADRPPRDRARARPGTARAYPRSQQPKGACGRDRPDQLHGAGQPPASSRSSTSSPPTRSWPDSTSATGGHPRICPTSRQPGPPTNRGRRRPRSNSLRGEHAATASLR
jgi:hypothetical protein